MRIPYLSALAVLQLSSTTLAVPLVDKLLQPRSLAASASSFLHWIITTTTTHRDGSKTVVVTKTDHPPPGSQIGTVSSTSVRRKSSLHHYTKTAPPASQATTQSTTSPAIVPDHIVHAILESHNVYRRASGVPDLVWNNDLATFARDHSTDCKFQHTHDRYGENLASGYESPWAGVKAWADEGSLYWNRHANGFAEDTGHYTAMIWRGTTQCGCYYTDCTASPLQGWLLRCNYDPPGNVIGIENFLSNVFFPALHISFPSF